MMIKSDSKWARLGKILGFISASEKKDFNSLKIILQSLNTEFNSITEQLQIIENENMNNTTYDKNYKIREEKIGELVRIQNEVSYEIIKIRKEIKNKSNNTILLTEMIVLSALFLAFIYWIGNFPIKTS